MKRKILSTLLVSAAIFVGTDANAQATDPLLAGAIGEQTLELKSVYKERHKDRNKILVAQGLITGALEEIHRVEDKYLEYMANASGVMQNLQQLRTIGELIGIDIPTNLIKLGKDIPHNIKGTAITLLVNKTIAETTADCTALGDIVQKLVTSKYSFKESKGDDKNVNLLSAAERYTILQDVVARLNNINRRLWMMDLYIKSFSWRDLWFGLDRESWCKAVYSRTLFNDFISRWNKLVKR